MSCPLFRLLIFCLILFIHLSLAQTIFTIMHRLSLVVESRDYSLFVVHGLVMAVASCCGAWAWTHVPCFGRADFTPLEPWGSPSCFLFPFHPNLPFCFSILFPLNSLSFFWQLSWHCSTERKSTSVLHIFISSSSMLCHLLSFNSHYPTIPTLSQNGNFSH